MPWQTMRDDDVEEIKRVADGKVGRDRAEQEKDDEKEAAYARIIGRCLVDTRLVVGMCISLRNISLRMFL